MRYTESNLNQAKSLPAGEAGKVKNLIEKGK